MPTLHVQLVTICRCDAYCDDLVVAILTEAIHGRGAPAALPLAATST